MSYLSSLTLVKHDAKAQSNPLERRKSKLIARLREQIELASNPAYVPTHNKRVKREDGSYAVVSVPNRIKRWWVYKADGTVELSVRSGAKKLELARGKDAILLKSADEVVPTLEGLIEATQGGELDTLLNKASGSIGIRKKL